MSGFACSVEHSFKDNCPWIGVKHESSHGSHGSPLLRQEGITIVNYVVPVGLVGTYCSYT